MLHGSVLCWIGTEGNCNVVHGIVVSCIVLCPSELYCIVLYCAVLSCASLYVVVLFCIRVVLCRFALYCGISSCIVLVCLVFCCIGLDWIVLYRSTLKRIGLD